MKIKIIYEDNHIIVVEKTAGVLTQQDKTGELSLLDMTKEHIKKKYSKPGNVFLGLVHRLDKQVSGVIVFARTSKAAARLSEQFRSKHVRKFYLAVTVGPGAITRNVWTDVEHNLIRQGDKTYIASENDPNAQHAHLKYVALLRSGEQNLLLIQLMTGRKHQIRAQMASLGMPIAGDTRYGSGRALTNNAICLHAVYLEFMHPTSGEMLGFFADVPAHFSSQMGVPMDHIKKLIGEK